MVQVHHALVNLSSLMVDSGTLLKHELRAELNQVEMMPHPLSNATALVVLMVRALKDEAALLTEQAPALAGAAIFFALWLLWCVLRCCVFQQCSRKGAVAYRPPPRLGEGDELTSIVGGGSEADDDDGERRPSGRRAREALPVPNPKPPTPLALRAASAYAAASRPASREVREVPRASSSSEVTRGVALKSHPRGTRQADRSRAQQNGSSSHYRSAPYPRAF